MSYDGRSDLSVLFAYIKQHLAGARQPTNGLAYRDPYDYYILKVMSPFNTGGKARKLTRDALSACYLDSSGMSPSGLDNPGQETRRAAAAAVLATAIIKAAPFAGLKALNEILINAGRFRAQSELRKVLTHGDVMPCRAHPRLTLKNFTSAGWQKQAYIDMTIEAYAQAELLLQNAHTHFIARKYNAFLSSRVTTAFERYFGKLSSRVDTRALQWNGNVPANASRMSHVKSVRQVLRRIHTTFFSNQPIRIYFGGKSMTGEDIAYTSLRPNSGLTRIHLSSNFFDYECNDRAGYLIHEMGHAWSRLQDHAYHDAGCSALARSSPGRALTNADSYGWFVKTAFR